jgi:small subunit ribosomal protein S1
MPASEESQDQPTMTAESDSEERHREQDDYQKLLELYDESMRNLTEGEIVPGRIIGVTSNAVIVDVGYKSEGLIPMEEFTDREGHLTVSVGDEVDVLLEKTEDLEGHVLLSRIKAQRMRRWTEVERAYKEGRVIKGRITDRIKGGLTVDVGLRAFLPGSLVDIKPVKNLESLRGHEMEFKVISLDRRRNNIVLSRKAVLETELVKKKAETLKKLEEGARLKGVVKNITDYGVFIDLGGIDGLLHITDISWGRVNHPSEHFSVGDEVEVVILKFDPETERVSLGYKQKGDDPWTLVDKKYPIGSRVRGRVVSLVDYGAFVEIEEGVEGLIHVSEMSWTKKVVNPAKILEVGDEVEAIVSELDMDQRRISLSLRQTERNPWEELADTHPEGTVIEGKVRNLTEFGAFVEITDGIDGLIHVSDMSWTKRVKHPSEVLKKGDVVKARITNIDVENQRVSLSIKEFMPNEWDDFSRKHKVGDVLSGRVVNVTDFGLFIDIYNGLEGLAHVSEIDVPSGVKLEDRFAVGDYVRTRILRIEEDDKKVGLSMRGVTQPTPNEISEMKAEAAARRHQAAAGATSATSAPSGAGGPATPTTPGAPAALPAAGPSAESGVVLPSASPAEAEGEEPQPQRPQVQVSGGGPGGEARGKRREGKKKQREPQQEQQEQEEEEHTSSSE